MGYSEYPPADVVADFNKLHNAATTETGWTELADTHPLYQGDYDEETREHFPTTRAWWHRAGESGLYVIRQGWRGPGFYDDMYEYGEVGAISSEALRAYLTDMLPQPPEQEQYPLGPTDGAVIQ